MRPPPGFPAAVRPRWCYLQCRRVVLARAHSSWPQGRLKIMVCARSTPKVFLVKPGSREEKQGDAAWCCAHWAREELPDGSPPLHQRIDTGRRSEEHTSELQSLGHIVCPLL